MVTGSEHPEFTNYDPSNAARRNFSPELDKGKLKFGITLIKTSQELPAFIRKKTQANQYKILSSNSVKINNYSAIKTSYVGPADNYNNSFTTVYIRNRSKSLIAEVDFIFGFENSFDLLNQILFGFKFIE